MKLEGPLKIHENVRLQNGSTLLKFSVSKTGFNLFSACCGSKANKITKEVSKSVLPLENDDGKSHLLVIDMEKYNEKVRATIHESPTFYNEKNITIKESIRNYSINERLDNDIGKNKLRAVSNKSVQIHNGDTADGIDFSDCI